MASRRRAAASSVWNARQPGQRGSGQEPSRRSAMLLKLAMALLLMAACVMIHAAGLTWGLRRIQRGSARLALSFAGATRLLIAVAAWSIVLHLLQIAVWAF